MHWAAHIWVYSSVLTINPYISLSLKTLARNENLTISKTGMSSVKKTCSLKSLLFDRWFGDISVPYFLYIQIWIVPASNKNPPIRLLDTVYIKHCDKPWLIQMSEIFIPFGQYCILKVSETNIDMNTKTKNIETEVYKNLENQYLMKINTSWKSKLILIKKIKSMHNYRNLFTIIQLLLS